MAFSVFVPDHEPGTKLPLLWYLSGLTCTHANVTEKGEFRAACARAGIIFVAPDTSPRGEGVPDDSEGAWDFGLGAGFYVDAKTTPWSVNYRMWTYVTAELPALVAATFPVDLSRQGLPPYTELPPDQPVTGWIAASLFRLALGSPGGPIDAYAWLQPYQPVARVGHSILLYYIPR